MDRCLTASEIDGLLRGRLGPRVEASFRAHLVACRRCRDLAAARSVEDKLFVDLKEAYDAAKGQTRPAGETVTLAARAGAAMPDVIGGYQILSEIHRGGQGVVYKAVQKSTKRTVALKVLLQGRFASRRQRHRFKREVDVVASLRHPHIVTLYDSGVTHDGQQYFAMEYIHGHPLDAYIEGSGVSVQNRLHLFKRICDAVSYAHQHGVIHRDLKPGNIRIDADGEPHILDFGLAKAAGLSLVGGVPVTATGEFMGTLAYASPEQVKGDPGLVDTRSDVYSMGVILFELLTGRYPYPVVGSMSDVLRNISDLEPQKPSTIQRNLSGELDTIVLKALAKERGRRYQSAGALSADIERFLQGQPIDARRESGWYRLGKTVDRHHTVFTFGGIIAGLVMVFVVFGVMLIVQSENTRQQDGETTSPIQGADAGLKDSNRQRLLQAREHQVRGEFAEAIAKYDEVIADDPEHDLAYANRAFCYFQLGDYTSALRDAEKAVRLNPSFVMARQLRDLAKKKIDEPARGKSTRVGSVKDHLEKAVALQRKRDYDGAIAEYDEVIRLDPKHDTAYANRGLCSYRKGDYEEAVDDLQEAVRIDPKFLGWQQLLDQARKKLGEQQAREAGHVESVSETYKEAIKLMNSGRLDDAIAKFSEVIALDPKHADAYANRGLAHFKKKEYREAVRDAEEALDISPRYRGAKSLLDSARKKLGQ